MLASHGACALCEDVSLGREVTDIDSLSPPLVDRCFDARRLVCRRPLATLVAAPTVFPNVAPCLDPDPRAGLSAVPYPRPARTGPVRRSDQVLLIAEPPWRLGAP
jgi:hypothetical protein